MSTWTMALSAALVDFLWQGALVGLIAWAVLVALQGRSANARYAVACAALGILTVLPLATVIAFAASAASVDNAVATASSGIPRPAPVPQTMLPIGMVSDSPRVAWLALVQLWALPVWSAGVVLFSLRLALAWWQAARLRRSGGSPDPEAAALVAKLAQRIGVRRRVRLLVSSVAAGPAVVGWLRPAVLLPPAAAMGLTPQQLEAVLAHELAHVRRHDYLVNLLQVVVETLFFYHPIVWWISKQIRTERELCCDDIAVRASGDPVGYARALTTLARRQLDPSGLAAAATGGPLMQRVQRLVGGTPAENGLSRAPGAVALALAAACVVLNMDWVQGFAEMQTAEDARFEVASVKRDARNDGLISDRLQNGRWTAMGYTVADVIRTAYGVQEYQIVGGPGWINSDKFDIAAKAPDDMPPAAPGAVPSRHQLMVRALLADRFNLAVHKETREMPVFALVMARPDGRLGPQMRRSQDDCTPEAVRARAQAPPAGGGNPWTRVSCGTSVGPGLISAGGRTMPQIATAFSRLTNTGSSLNRLVVDRTGLAGTYDLELRFTPENVPPAAAGIPGLPAIDPNGPSIFAAVQEQLGLKLDAQRGPVEVLVIDRVEPPTPD
jgi:uncharacterized protein (TIGR03435 family)